jgi:metallo-beta-lactamase family protein
LYTEQEARQFLEHLQPVAYHEPKALTDELNFEYLHAGHILGSAMIRLNYTHNGGQKILFFPGDLGRSGQPVIKDPETVEGADYLLLESTYGGRTHQQVDVQAYLEELVQQTVREGGSLIILVFAGGRVLHHLKSRLSDRRNTVLFVGFQPQGSLGRLISEGKEEVKSMGSGCP